MISIKFLEDDRMIKSFWKNKLIRIKRYFFNESINVEKPFQISNHRSKLYNLTFLILARSKKVWKISTCYIKEFNI